MKIELRRAALTYQAPDGEVAALRDVTFGVRRAVRLRKIHAAGAHRRYRAPVWRGGAR